MIIQTRILPPRFSNNIVHRNDAQQLIKKNANKKLILISSPAGYGKTTLAQEFLANLTNQYCWLHITPEMSNINTFFMYLIHSFKQLNNNFGVTTLELLQTLSQQNESLATENNDVLNESYFNQITGSFINELVEFFEDSVYSVLDDLHELSTSYWFKTVFSNLLEDLPSNIHFIATSRFTVSEALPGFSLLKAKGYIYEIGLNELTFNTEEICSLLKDIYSYNKIDDELFNTLSRFKGWITGIHLYLQTVQNLHKPATKIKEISLSTELYNYFANEIFNNLNKDLQNFLLTTSILSNFDEEVCNFLIGFTNSSKYLNELLNRNIFIEVKDEQSDKGIRLIYNYQNLFSSYLTKKAEEILGTENLEHNLRKIKEYYKLNRDYLMVIEYSIKCKDWGDMLEYIYRNLQELMRGSNYYIINYWLSQINTDPDSKPWECIYRYLKALVERNYTGNIITAYNEINTAINCLHSADLQSSRLPANNKVKLSDDIIFAKDLLEKCELLRIELLLKQGKIDTAINEINNKITSIETNDVLDITENANKQNKIILAAKYYYLLGYAYQIKSEFTSAEKYLCKSAEIALKYDIIDLLYDAYNILGNVFLNKGDFIRAIHYYELTLLKSKNLFNKLTVLSNLTILYARSFKLEEALKYFYEAQNLYNTLITPSSLSLITANLMLKYALHFEFMDFETAITTAKEINEISTENNDTPNIYLSLAFIGECYYYMNKIESAKEYYELASKYCSKDSYSDVVYCNYLTALINKYYLWKNNKDSSNAHDLKFIKQIEKNFLDAYMFYDNEESYFDKSVISYHTADYYFKTGNIQTALNYLKTTLNICSQKDNISFLIREYLFDKRIFDLALENKIDISFVKHISQLSLNSADIFNKLKISNEAMDRIQKNIFSSYDMIINLFGEPEITVRGEKITDDRWSRKKRKLIFLYLALNSQKIITKDKLIDIFFTDTPIESIDNQFHQTLSNIRNALKPSSHSLDKSTASKKIKADSAKLTPGFIIYEDKIIKFNPLYTYFIDKLEFDKNYNLHFSSESDENLKIIAAKTLCNLYKGEFLSGYYESWCEDLRIEYQNKMIKILESAFTLSKKLYSDCAIYFLQKLILIDKINENAYYELASLLKKTNRYEEAKALYKHLKKIYKYEMDAELPKNTEIKFKELFE